MKKKIITVSVIIILFILLFPVQHNLKDGGSKVYDAVLYKVTKYHTLAEEPGEYYGGLNIEIFGIDIYDNKYLIET